MERTASDISSSVDRSTGTVCRSRSLRKVRIKEHNGRRKLSADGVMRVLSMIATFTEVPKIIKTVKDEFGLTMSASAIENYKYSENYKAEISKIRERWGQDLMNVELANKRRRLEELEKIYHHSFETDQMKNALGAIYQIQGEVEKNLQQIGTQTNYQINIYKDMTETELEEERVKSLERLKVLKQLPEIKELEHAVRLEGV